MYGCMYYPDRIGRWSQTDTGETTMKPAAGSRKLQAAAKKRSIDKMREEKQEKQKKKKEKEERKEKKREKKQDRGTGQPLALSHNP